MTNLLPAIPEGLKVLRNAHGYNHYFTHLQMDAYGRACADAAINADKAQRDKLLTDAYFALDQLIGGMLQRGVPVDKNHPYRVQVDEGEAVIVNIKKAIADSLGVQE